MDEQTIRVHGGTDRRWYFGLGGPISPARHAAKRLRLAYRLRYMSGVWDRVHVVRIDDPRELPPGIDAPVWYIMGPTDGKGAVELSARTTFAEAIDVAQTYARSVSR